MVLIIVLSLIGLMLGAVSLGDLGWLFGALTGFMLGRLIQLGNKLSLQSKELANLREWQQKINARLNANVGSKASAPVPEMPPEQFDNSVSALADEVQARDPQTLGPQQGSSAQSHTAETKFELDLNLPDMVDVTDDKVAAETTPKNLTTQSPVPRAGAGTSVSNQPSQSTGSTKISEDPFSKLFNWVATFFTQGNPIVRVGMIVMFFGLSFLVKYASSQGLFPIEFRLALVAAVAMALMVIGWKTKNREGGYGLVLQGGGIAALYLTIFAAAKLYSAMPLGVAFFLMLLVVLLGALLAILQNAQVLALMATAGGFLVPILTSDGTGNQVALFSYYLLLNIGLLAISWFKAWRLLNWIGFVFTFVITSAWSILDYAPQLYFSTQPFLIAFFALYLCISILFSIKQPPQLKGLIDASLVFGLPIVSFGLQATLLKHTDYGVAISALILSAIYLLVVKFLWSKYRQTHQALIESFIALALCFATLAIPLALGSKWSSASWALEATGLIWVGLRQQRLLPRVAGYLLHLAAAFALFIRDGIEVGAVPVVTGDFIGLMILALSALAIAFLLMRYAIVIRTGERPLLMIGLVLGWSWWLFAGFNELQGHLSEERLYSIAIIFVALSVWLLQVMSDRLSWSQLATTGYWLLPLISLWVLRNQGEALFIGYGMHPLQDFGWLALAIFFGVNYWFLWRKRAASSQGFISIYHVLSAWFLLAIILAEAQWWQEYNQWLGTSEIILWFAVFTLPLIFLLVFIKRLDWPFKQYAGDYKNIIPLPLVVFMFAWFIYAAHFSGATSYLYLPIFNPIDLAQLSVLLLLGYMYKWDLLKLAQVSKQVSYGIMGAVGFAWLNLVLLRAMHHYAGIDYSAMALWNSSLVQMALSILWALCALVIMNRARHLQVRQLWILGAGLLGLILLKLFTKDLSGTGTLARIISFMVVGGLMLLIGYLSPIPVKKSTTQDGVSS